MDLLYIFTIIASAFDIIGVLVVVWGGVVAVFTLLQTEVLHSRHKKKHHIELLRMDLGQKLVLGLEFFLVGDLIRFVGGQDADALIRLAVIVVARTVLSYFLTREISSAAKFHLLETKRKS